MDVPLLNLTGRWQLGRTHERHLLQVDGALWVELAAGINHTKDPGHQNNSNRQRRRDE